MNENFSKGLIFCFLLVALLVSCTMNVPARVQSSQESIPAPTVTPASLQQPGGQTGSSITAEGVVYTFLTTYEDNPDEMIPFLSTNLRENLPEGGVLALLDFVGTLEGLVFTSGTSGVDPNTAVVEARLQVDGVEIQRVFYLERLGERWVITAVEKK